MAQLLTSTCVCLVLSATLVAQTVQVQWANERLGIQANGVPLRAVVEAVAQRAGIEVTGADRLSGRVSIEFRDTPLVEGLSQLLEGVNYVVTRRAGVVQLAVHSMSGTAPSLAAAATGPIFIRGLSDQVPNESGAEPASAEPVELDEEEKEELAELEGAVGDDAQAIATLVIALDSDYPRVRMRAVHAMAGRDPALAVEHLGDRLFDEERDIAMTAADILAGIPGGEALEALAAYLGPDADPDSQAAALRGLARRADPASIPRVRRAIEDLDPALRDFASQLLRELEDRVRASRQ